jgi:LysR family transcriptional regulator, hydrogen peroxide-inducible genes activator
MDINQLRDFVTVASCGSFSQAALKSRVSQPSLSKAVQRLEAEVGEKLFIRLKRRSVLTSAGEITLKRAVRILNEVEEMRREVGDTHGLRRGSVNAGILPTIAPYLLPRVISRFTEACPGLEIVVHEDMTANLLRMVDTCEIDLAIMSLPIANGGFEREVLFTEELLLAVPAKHPLAVKERITIADLEQERFILMKEGHCLGDQILSFCTQNDLHLQIVLRSSQIETVQSLVMAGLGMSLVPQMARIGGKTPLVYRSLENPKPMRTNVVVWRKGREHSRATAEFLKHLRETVQAQRETLVF